MAEFDLSRLLRPDPLPSIEGSFLSLLGPKPLESAPLTVANLRAALDGFREREEQDARMQGEKYRTFIDSLPEGIMESSVLTDKEVRELRTIASVVAASVIEPLNPQDAKVISERVGVLVAKHKRWSR